MPIRSSSYAIYSLSPWGLSCLSGIVLYLVIDKHHRLINMLEFELKPILLKTNDTLAQSYGTTVFASENVMGPVTKASSYRPVCGVAC